MFPTSLLVVLFAVVLVLSNAIRILKEYERAVVFRLGRVIAVKGPGLILLIPIVDRMVKVDLRTITLDVPPQDIITRDNVSMKVNAVVYFRVVDAVKAIIAVERFLYATTSWPRGRRSTSGSRRFWTTRPRPGASRSRACR